MTLKTAILLATLCVTATGTAFAADTALSDVPETAVEAWQADKTRIFDASEVSLEEFQWLARPVVVFADTEADPRFRQQIDLITSRVDELAERDVVVITDTNPRDPSDLRTALRPRGFMLAIVSKDGTVLIRKPLPWDVREISRSIDKLPLRQQEIRDRTSVGG